MKTVKYISIPLLFFFFAAYMLYLCVRQPVQNWDMIAYIAIAKSFEEQDINSVHTFTFEQVRNSVTLGDYKSLAQEDEEGYRHSMRTDVAAFQEQLPNYRTRLVYTLLIFVLYKSGLNIIFATHLVSGLAIVCAIAILYLISIKFIEKGLIYALPFLAVLFGLPDLARISTPDGLAFLAVIGSVYLYSKSRVTLLLIVLPIIIGVRPDLILFTIPLLFFIFLFDTKNRWKAALSAIISIAVYSCLGAYFGYVGWSVIFYHSFVELSARQISAPPTLTANQYFYILFKGSIILFFNKAFLVYALLSGYSFYLIWSGFMKTSAAFKPVPSVLTYVYFIYSRSFRTLSVRLGQVFYRYLFGRRFRFFNVDEQLFGRIVNI